MTGLLSRAPAPTRLLAVALATVFWFGCSGEPGDSPTEPAVEVARGGTPGPPQELGPALEAQKRHGPALMRIEGVVGHGVGFGQDGEPGITVYTLTPGVAGLPSRLDGVPVRTVVTGRFVAGTTTRERPAPNGFSVGHPDITAGTLGAIVQGSDDACYILSNNHVLANSNEATIGDAALQPGPFDGGSDPADAIGTLSDFVPIFFDGSDNKVDAAIAVLFDADSVTGSTPAGSYGAPGTSPTAAAPEMAVQKFGRTTGHTEGTVEETNVTVTVCYACSGPFCFRCTQSATFTDQIGISPGDFSDGGDSGSLIVDGSANPVGLLFAGSSTRTLANPIGDVLSAFTVSVTSDLGSCTNGSTGGDTTDEAPSVSITSPSDGATVSGSVTLEASASDDNGVDQVEFFANTALLGTDTDGSNGWSVGWNTESVDDGPYDLTARATDTADQTTTSAVVSVTVDNVDDGGGSGEASVIHVGDLDGSSDNNGSTWTVHVSILVEDGTGAAVSGAVVDGSWSGGASGTDGCTTEADGRCTVSQSGIHKSNASATWSVTGVTADGLTYDQSANTDPDGDSDGTTITVPKP